MPSNFNIIWSKGQDISAILVECTVNGRPVEFNLDSGAGKSFLQWRTAATVFPQGINKVAKNWQTAQTSWGTGERTQLASVDVTLTIGSSEPFVTEMLVNSASSNIQPNLLSLNDVTKVFDIHLTNDTIELTPLARPYKNTNKIVKSSRLGWSSDWI